MTADSTKVTLEEALAEVEREMNVRLKCFDRWITEGRIAKVDARDRLNRMHKAFTLLQTMFDLQSSDPNVPEGKPVGQTDDIPF
jgi:hypothetical protein